MPKALELKAGQKFCRLTVVKKLGSSHKNGVVWECLCDCGNTTVKSSGNLQSQGHTSCGCAAKEPHNVTHGLTIGTHSGTKLPIEYRMLISAKHRAKRDGFPFNLSIEDIVVPEFCPVFTDVRLNRNTETPKYDSPSLDKLIPSLGYVKGNVRVVSYRVNAIKHDATWQELLAVSNWLKGETDGTGNKPTA